MLCMEQRLQKKIVLLRNWLFVIWWHGTKVYKSELHHGLPSTETIDELTSEMQHALIVLDYSMHRVVQNTDMEALFTQGCHLRRLSVIFITQNLFPRGSKSRNIALNTSYYLILMKNARDVSQVTTLLDEAFRYIRNNPLGTR